MEYGLPVQILSDNGREFLFIEELGIFHRRTANYRPESNGRIERKHLELSKISRIHGKSPDEIVDVINSEQSIMMFSEFRNKSKIKPDELVLRYVPRRMRSKEQDVWKGPYEISSIIGDHTYVLLDEQASVVHEDDLKPFAVDSNSFFIDESEFTRIYNDSEDPSSFVWIFKSWKDAWKRNWIGQRIFVQVEYESIMDAFIKMIHEIPERIILIIPNQRNLPIYRMLRLMAAEWYGVKDRAWIVEVQGDDLKTTIIDWGGVEGFISFLKDKSMSKMKETELHT